MTQDPTKPSTDQELSLEDFEEQVRAQAGIRPDVWKGMMAQESAGGRKTTSPTGVKGRWQVTEAVAKQYGLDRNNPFHQATAAAKYLREQYDGMKHVKDDDERWLSAVARYYGGPDAVGKDGTVSNVSRDGYATPAIHIQRVAEKMAEAAKSSSPPTFQPSTKTPPSPQSAPSPQKKKAPLVNPFDFNRPLSETLTRDAGQRETAVAGTLRRPLPPPAPRKTPARFQGLRDAVDNEDRQALPEPSAEDRAKAAFRAKSIPAQMYEEAKDIPGRLVTAVASPLQRVKVIGEGLRNADPEPLIATAGELAAGAVKGYHDISKNTGKVLPETPGGYLMRQILPSRADAQQVGERAKAAYEKGAQRYSYDDPLLPTFNELKGWQAQDEYAASLRPGMPAGVVRAIGGALPAVATGAAGGLRAALATQAAMGDVENPVETAANMASVAVPMGLTAAARPALNAATKAMAPVPRTLSRLGGEMAVGGAGNVGQELVTQPLLTGTIDPQRLVESGVVGSLFGINDVAQQSLANRRATGRAPVPPVVPPRSTDTNLTPDEVATPATGAQSVIDPVTGLPTPEVSNPATDAKVDDIFGQILGRKPDRTAEKAQAAAQDVQKAVALADEASAAGDVNAEVAALKTALKRKPDVETEVKLQARLAALEPASATKKIAGQRAPVNPTLPEFPVLPKPASETAPLVDAVADAPTADIPQIDPNQQVLMDLADRRAQAKAEKNYALAESTAVGELAALQARQKQVDLNNLAAVAQFASAVRALQLEIKSLQKLQADEAKAAAPAKAPRVASPKGPKVVTPKAEGVRKRQGVLKGIVPDQSTLIDNPAAMENRQGGIPPVEPVAKSALPFEDLADREKAKVNKRANMSPIEYLKQASKGEGFRVVDSGEAEGVSAKDAKIVAFTNQDSQYGMNDAAVMLDEGGYFMPDGRRFTDPDVKEADVLDYLKQYGKQSSAGNTGGIDPRIADEEAAYYEQKAADEAAPTGSTRLPSGLIGEPRRPQPIETSRNRADVRQQALAKVDASDLPESFKQRLRARIPEADEAFAQSVLDDSDIQAAPQRVPVEQAQQVELRKTGTDNAPVVEMPKRATPPKPIPDDIKRVYGEKVTPEQAEAIQRRAENRASVEVGLGGKFGDMARKSFMSSRGTSELPTLVEHPALREALGLPEMPAYLVEDGRVSKLWQEAAQHTLDGLAEWGGVQRSSKAGDNGLGRIQEAIAERVSDPSIDEVFMRTVVATDTAQKRLGAVLSHPDVKAAIEAAQAEIADQRARGLKSLALRKSGKALDAALESASEQALKDFPADAIGSYGKDWSTITKNAIEEFRADLRAERLGPDGNPESWIGRRLRESGDGQDGETPRQSADAPLEQAAARSAESTSGRAPAQEGTGIQAQAENVEPRVGGYVRKNGRIYEIVKYHPKEGTVWIQEPGSPGAQAIPQAEVRKLTIPDDVAKAEIGETPKEGQPSQEQPQAPGREETPEVKDRASEIGEGVRRAAEEAKRRLRKSEGQTIKPEVAERLDSIAEEAKQRLRKRGKGRLSSGIDPADLADYAVIGAAKVAKGAVQFADWSAQMVKQFGEAIRPHLEEIWAGAHDYVAALKEYRRGEDPITNLRTRYFDKALAQSKVRTASGDIATVYHGTQSPAEIQKIDPQKFDSGALYGPGFYTTQDVEVAAGEKGYAGTKKFEGRLSVDQLRNYYTPGRIVPSYAGYDKVLKFHEQGSWGSPWSVEVIAVEKDGSPKPGARPRVHQTPPSGSAIARPHAYEYHLDIRNPFDINSKYYGATVNDLLTKAAAKYDASDPYALHLNGPTQVRTIHDDAFLDGNDLYGKLKRLFNGDKQAVNKFLAEEGYDGITHTGGSGEARWYKTESEARKQAEKTGGILTDEAIREGRKHEDPLGVPSYKVVGHRVWIAFKPEQVYSAQADFAPRAAEAMRQTPSRQDLTGTTVRQPNALSKVEYRGSGPNVIQEIKNIAAALSGRAASAKYKLPGDQGKLKTEVEGLAKIVRRYAKAREDAGLPMEPELVQSLTDNVQKIADSFQSGDQKGYQNARKAIDDAFVKFGVEAPSFASTRRAALKTWDKYRKAQEAAGKPLSPEYAQALVDVEQRLRFANRDGDVHAYYKAKRELDWLTQKIEAKENPATLGDKLLTLRAVAHFLNPKFVIRNVLSQPIVWGGDKIDNAVAATISKVAAAVRGKKSVVGLDDFSTLSSLVEGGKLALEERKEGKSIDPQYGLHPHAFEGKAGRALEDALFFINRLPDDAFYHGYFTAKLNDLAQQYKGSKDVSIDQIIDQAHLEANKLAMRDKNWVSENLKRIQRGLNRASTLGKSEKIGVGTLVLNYAQYPGAALKRAMEHSPLGLIDVAIEANKPGPFRERNVINALSRTLTGTALTFGIGTLLGTSGIMTEGLPEDDKQKKRLREIGFRPYQLNASALSRWFTGGFSGQRYQDGDKLVSIDWAQPWAMLLAAGAATGNAWNREMSKTDKAQETAKAMYDSVASFMDTLGDQSVVKNLTRYMETAERAVKYGESGTAAVARDIADDIVSSNVPVVFNQIRQYMDPVNRSTWAEEQKDGKTFRKEGVMGFLEETAIRRPQSRIPYVAEHGIPGALRGLPPVPGSRKQVTYTPQPENNSAFNAFLNPSNVSTVRPEDQKDRELLDTFSQPRKKEEKKRKPIEQVRR